MTMTSSKELQKTIDIAKEFIQRADDLIGEIEHEEALMPDHKFYRDVSSKDVSAVRRQSMELTRQLAILRRA